MEKGFREVCLISRVGYKRIRQVEEDDTHGNKNGVEELKDIKQVYPLLRDRKVDDEYRISLTREYHLDPPEIGQFLGFVVNMESKEISRLTHKISMSLMNQGQSQDIEKCTKELGEMITTDPRLGILLEEHFLKLLVDFLCDEQNSVLQLNAVNILLPVVAYTSNREVVIRCIKPPIIVNLMRSKDYDLQVQALQLLRTIALAFPGRLETAAIVEEALETLTCIITEQSPDPEVLDIYDSPDHKVLYNGSNTLAAICQEHPNLPGDKLGLVLLAIKNLFQYQDYEIVENACTGFSDLCDGKKTVLVDRDDLNNVIDQLIVFIDSQSRVKIIAGLKALGSIVRWGSDDDIQVLLDKEGLWSLECLLGEEDKYFVMDACWILSNITGRKENHIEAVIKHECIDALVSVIQNYKWVDVKEEATWAILNAIRGANLSELTTLRDKCFQPLWESMNIFSDYPRIICACLEGLVRMKWVEVTCQGEIVDDVEFNKCLGELQERRVQLADDIEGLPKSKRLRTTGNTGIYDSNIISQIMFTPKM